MIMRMVSLSREQMCLRDYKLAEMDSMRSEVRSRQPRTWCQFWSTLWMIGIMAGLSICDGVYADIDEGIALYENGHHVDALPHLSRAALDGEPRAHYLLGRMYFEGSGVSRDHSRSFEYFKVAAEQGHFEAQNMVGYMLMEGIGVDADNTEAEIWLGKAVRSGHESSMNNLGLLKARSGHEKQALDLFRQSAALGHQEAMNNLGFLYTLAGNQKEALRSYHRAAELGLPEAMFNLANLWKQGVDGLTDIKESAIWSGLAMARGHVQGRDMFQETVQQLSVSERQAIQKEVKKRGAMIAERSRTEKATRARQQWLRALEPLPDKATEASLEDKTLLLPVSSLLPKLPLPRPIFPRGCSRFAIW